MTGVSAVTCALLATSGGAAASVTGVGLDVSTRVRAH